MHHDGPYNKRNKHQHRNYRQIIFITTSLLFLLTQFYIYRQLSPDDDHNDHQPPHPRILICVTTSQKYLSTRVQAIQRTWAKNLPSSIAIRYFLGENHGRLSSAPNVLALPGVKDNEYPLVGKAISIIQKADQIVAEQSEVEWILDVDDDVYVDISNLQTFLSKRDPLKLHYIGRRGAACPQHIQYPLRRCPLRYLYDTCYKHKLLGKHSGLFTQNGSVYSPKSILSS